MFKIPKRFKFLIVFIFQLVGFLCKLNLTMNIQTNLIQSNLITFLCFLQANKKQLL